MVNFLFSSQSDFGTKLKHTIKGVQHESLDIRIHALSQLRSLLQQEKVMLTHLFIFPHRFQNFTLMHELHCFTFMSIICIIKGENGSHMSWDFLSVSA